MRNHYELPFKGTLILLLFLALMLPKTLLAQSINFYYAAPTNTMINAFGAANVSGGFASGFRGILVGAGNVVKFKQIASTNMLKTYENLQAGTDLRKHVDKLLKIADGKVDVYYILLDDRNGLGANSGIFVTDTHNGKKISWPVAWVSPASGGRYNGYVNLSEESSNLMKALPGGWKAWESVVLHETNHTQYVGDKTKWGSIHITYGGDKSHWTSEFLGDQELAFEEGIGTFFGHVRNDPEGAKGEATFFSRTDERYALESWSVLAPDLYRVPHKEKTRTPPTPPATPGGRYAVRYYKWKDVPGFYILFSESTSTGFHLYFWKHVNSNKDQAYDMIIKSANAMWKDRKKRYLAYAVNRLALQMEAFAATAGGQAAKAAGKLTSSMYPFALLDLLTHFGMSDQEYKKEYERNYPDKNPQAFTRYWQHRNPVKQLVKADLDASPIRFEKAVSAVHGYFQKPETILAAP